MDDKDRALVGALAANARESLVALARRVGLSRSATQERLRRLERDGTIRGYTVRLAAAEDGGGGASALIAVGFASGFKCADVLPQLRLMPEIGACLSLAGPTDLMLRVGCSSTAELERVRARIEGIPGVASTTTHVVLASHW